MSKYDIERVTKAKIFLHTWSHELSMMEEFNENKGVVDTISEILVDAQYKAIGCDSPTERLFAMLEEVTNEFDSLVDVLSQHSYFPVDSLSKAKALIEELGGQERLIKEIKETKQ